MKKQLIVKILNNIADILELQEVEFKPIAYRRAAQSVEALSEDIEQVHERGELEEIPGVGKHIAEKIAEIIETGRLKYYEKLKKEVKVDVESLNQIPNLGPKKIKVLYKQLGVKDIKDLEKVLKQHKVKELQGFGEKTEETLLHGIELLKKRPSRFLYVHALPIVEMITKTLQKYDFITKVEVAGSYRRGKETVGDLDFLAVSSQPAKVMDIFTKMKDVTEVLAKGETKSSVRLSNGLQVDLRVVHEKEYGAALLYFIGSKEHNVELRKLALKRGWTLNEYGLTTLADKRWIAGKTQEEIYQKLGLHFIEPELRENRGEIEAARLGKLPTLVTVKDIKGVFHNHSRWSDGNNSLLEMAQKAEALKLKFISFFVFLPLFLHPYVSAIQGLSNLVLDFSDYHHLNGEEPMAGPNEPVLDLDAMAQDFVLETKRIDFPDYPGAFNPSIVRWNGRLLMSFRIYHPHSGSTNPFALVWLDEHFDPIGTPQIFELPHYNTILPSKQQDPRLISVSGRLFIVYNNLLASVTERELRRVFVVEMHFDGEKFIALEPECLCNFEGDSQMRYEKNWVPFEYEGNLLLAYSLIPHRILRPIANTGSASEFSLSRGSIQWNWGIPRGGTQALLDGDHYLSFFHSSKDIPTVQSNGRKISHYVIGAYTFDAKPPFAINAVSPQPIVSKDFYAPPYYRTWKPMRCVFPCGFVFDEDFVWIAYGRQDHEIWIAKIDKKRMYNSLIPVTTRSHE